MIQESYTLQRDVQSLRKAIQQSIAQETRVEIELTETERISVTFEKFLNESCARGTSDDNKLIVALLPPERIGSDLQPVIVVGQ